ncbi:MAG: TetR/AcrR family transcriptional regulator [Myxococcota bacterium]
MENGIPSRFTGVSARLASPATEPGPAAAGGAVGSAVDRSLARRRATAQDEVERLVTAAFSVIERTGHLEPKVSDILREAGLSNQAFYRHFAGKHALLVTVLDEGIRGLARYLAQRMDGIDDPVEAVREWIRGMAAQATDPTGARASRPFALARGRLAESFPAEVADSERRVAAPLRAVLERGRERGRMPEVDAETESEALYHLMMGWVEARLVAGRQPSPDEVDALEALALAGLTRGAAPALAGASVVREDETAS